MSKEHEEIYEKFCKHQRWLLNQGVYWCEAGYNYTRCDKCQHRESIEYVIKISSASIESI